MNKPIRTLSMTLGFLVILDILVAGVLHLADTRITALRPLQRYFEYGRSVPGKIQIWVERPGASGNLFSAAWMPELIEKSSESFSKELPETGPTIRAYGMSFVDNILSEAATQHPGLRIDSHAGPAAPPNFTYSVFLDDAANRRENDVAVLGILSSSVPALAAFSNRTWMFEQPAPFTYPVFRPDAKGGLTRIDPLIRSEADQRALASEPDAAAAWDRQIRRQDGFHSPVTFDASFLDYSPFLRLVRRSLARDLINRRKQAVLAHGSETREVLRRLVSSFAEKSRQEAVLPVVFLIQTRDPRDIDLLASLRPVLDDHDIPYLATSEQFDPRETGGFREDGHYKRAVDKLFAGAFLEILRDRQALP